MGPLRPTHLMKEIIYIKTNRLGFIPQIHMQGPIVTPIPVTREAAKSMVVAGIEVFEVYKDRSGNKQVRLLTLKNVYPGEGEPPEKPDHDKDGEQKPPVPTSGVAQQEPVKPVDLKGVSIPEAKSNEPTTEEVEETEELPEEEEKKEETAEDPKPQNTNNTNGNRHNKNKNKNKNK